MRCLLKISIPVETGNATIGDGTLPKTIESILNELKPEAAYFAEENGKLYVMTRSDAGKYKRIRNHPEVRIAPSTMRGKVTGPEFSATARILPPEDWPHARQALARKYWLMKVPFLWSKKNVFLELEMPQ